MPAREKWSLENAGSCRGLCYTTVAGGGEGRGFSYLLESHMTYLDDSHVLRSWPGIWLRELPYPELPGLFRWGLWGTFHCKIGALKDKFQNFFQYHILEYVRYSI
jgi:hypothetical protein